MGQLYAHKSRLVIDDAILLEVIYKSQQLETNFYYMYYTFDQQSSN